MLTRKQLVERVVEAGRDPVERDNLYRVLSTDREIEAETPLGIADAIPVIA